ncbi:MAG: dienelactone hydrolase family protein [Gemmatimonadaceae bacterium]
MPTHDVAAHATLYDFTSRWVMLDGVSKTVYVAGRGPAVVVMHEMPGIGAHVLRFARWVRDAGFTVYLPSLFGRDGVDPSADDGAMVFRRACVSAEFRALGGGSSSPVTSWLRALARLAHDECGGPGVGAIGMCFTGNFALAMMLEPAVIAPVVAQPALPLDNPAGLEIADDELHAIRRRLEREDLTVLAYRFAGDRFCRAERFAAYQEALGERFIGRVLPDESARVEGAPPFHAQHVNFPHSVVTVHLLDEEGSATSAARDEIIAFLSHRLATVA